MAASLLKQIDRASGQPEGEPAPAKAGGIVGGGRVGIGRSAQTVLERIDDLADDDLDALYRQMLAEEER